MSKLLTDVQMWKLRKSVEEKYPWIRVKNTIYKVDLIAAYKVTFKNKQTEEEFSSVWNS